MLTDANGCLLNSIWVSFHLDQKSSSCSESKQQNQEDPTFTSPVVKCTFSQEVYNGSDNRTNRGFVLNLSERFSLQRTVLGWEGGVGGSTVQLWQQQKRWRNLENRSETVPSR